MAFKGRVNRRARSDRNHVIYQVKNNATGQIYIGLTFVRPPTKKISRSKMPLKSALDRFTSHCYRSRSGSDTLLHKNIRQFGKSSFSISVLEIIRGKAEAHQRETIVIQERKPQLNMVSMYYNSRTAEN